MKKKKNDERINILVQLLSTQHDKATLYSNLIIGAGYAGFFSVWGNIQCYLTDFEKIFSMLCITISLIFFILWEIGKMISTALFSKYQSKILESSPQDFDKNLRKMDLNGKVFNIIQMRLWVINLVLTIIPALLGVGILVYGLFRSLF